jgi:serine/threonine protein kinase
MSANREDALNEQRVPRLPLDAPVSAGRDPTEDLADEITSELGATPRLAPPGPKLPAAAAPQPETASGESVLRDRYLLETQLGAGGTAVVFRAIDLRRDANAVDGRRVAIKLLRPELRDRPHAVARLQREFRQSQAAAHAGVVRMFDLDCERGTWFIVMELLTGETLGPRLRRAAPSGLPADEALRIAGAACDALAHAHAVGVIHGDVKPDNLFLTGSGELRVLDFGVAPESTSAAAADSVPAAATRVYASPEVLAGSDPEPRDDVFSLACVTYEMLAGAHPFGRRGADRAVSAGAAPARIESLDGARWSALDAALSLRRDSRPGMAEFARGLRGERRGERPTAQADALPPVAPASATTLPDAAPATPSPARVKLAIAAVAAVILALALGILIGRMREPGNAAAPPSPRLASPEMAGASKPEPTPAAVIEAPRPEPAPPPLPAAPEPEAVTGPPGIVYFDSPRMIVSKHAVVAAIPMRNLTHARRVVSVTWRIIEGSARAGRDFAGPLGGTESFIEGNSFRILYVPILQDPGAAQDRRFTVEMTAVSADTAFGPTPRVEVTILGDA